MKAKAFPALILFLIFSVSGYAQGTLIFDQQSSTNETPFGGGAIIQQLATPYGQSFTPTLTSIGFIKLQFSDNIPGNGLGATLYVNLRAASMGGTIIGTTIPVALRDGFVGMTNFLFAAPVSLTPGTTYYFEPVVQNGDPWNVNVAEYNYAGGAAYYQGQPFGLTDYWFREGIVVPEPSSTVLALIGGGVLLWSRRQEKKTREPCAW